jgi:hypothetical protein
MNIYEFENFKFKKNYRGSQLIIYTISSCLILNITDFYVGYIMSL